MHVKQNTNETNVSNIFAGKCGGGEAGGRGTPSTAFCMEFKSYSFQEVVQILKTNCVCVKLIPPQCTDILNNVVCAFQDRKSIRTYIISEAYLDDNEYKVALYRDVKILQDSKHGIGNEI